MCLRSRFTHQGKVYETNVFVVEANYLDFFGLELVQGRNFDPHLATDTTEAILVNQALVRAFNMTDPLGKPIPGLPTEGGPTPLIAGVVKDYHFQTFYQEIAPAMLTLNPAWGYDYLMVRIQPTDLSKDFVKLVLVGVVLAAPVAYFVMQRWLEHFAFRIDISGWTFLLVGL